MAQGPYAYVSQASNLLALGLAPAGTVQLTAVDTMNVSAQREILYIRTQLAPPYPAHPLGLEIAALTRVRDLIEQQIQAMQGP
jgi:hypothetical protein